MVTKSLNLWLCYWQQIAVVVDEQLAGQGMCWVYILQSSSEFFFFFAGTSKCLAFEITKRFKTFSF